MSGKAEKPRGPKWRCWLNNKIRFTQLTFTTTFKIISTQIGATRNEGFLWNGVWTQKPKTSIFEFLFGAWK